MKKHSIPIRNEKGNTSSIKRCHSNDFDIDSNINEKYNRKHAAHVCSSSIISSINDSNTKTVDKESKRSR